MQTVKKIKKERYRKVKRKKLILNVHISRNTRRAYTLLNFTILYILKIVVEIEKKKTDFECSY